MSRISVPADRAAENLLAALKEEQARFGFLSRERLAELAASFNTPLNDVYSIASFYSFLSIRPSGRNIIRVCKSVPCYLKHNRMIFEAVEKAIGIKPGQTTPDRRFSFEFTNCIGLCDRAPAMLINNDAHASLTPESIPQILRQYK